MKNNLDKSHIDVEYMELLEDELEKEKKAREDDKKFYDDLIAEYEQTIAKLKNDNIILKGKNQSQAIILESYKAKVGTPLIVSGKEQDLYDSEQKDLIIDLIQSAYNNSQDGTRVHDIYKSILQANPENGYRRRLKTALAEIFKKYAKSDLNIIDILNDAGVSAEYFKNGHIKITINGDDRYIVSVSSTPSDYRSGMNALADINKMFF